MAREKLKKDKICIVCGTTFKAIASAQTCTPACRAILVRLKKEGKRPEYIFVAKGKGQKIPDLNAPKRLKFKKGEKKLKPEIMEDELNSKIEWATPTPESYDAPPLSYLVMDEIGLTAPVKPMNPHEMFEYNAEINRQIKEQKDKPLPPGMHPKTFKLQQDDIVDTLKKLLK